MGNDHNYASTEVGKYLNSLMSLLCPPCLYVSKNDTLFPKEDLSKAGRVYYFLSELKFRTFPGSGNICYLITDRKTT